LIPGRLAHASLAILPAGTGGRTLAGVSAMRFFFSVIVKTVCLALPASISRWANVMRLLGWILAIGSAFGIGWATADWTSSVPIGTTGINLQIGPIIAGVLCVLAVCFAVAWITVPWVAFTRENMRYGDHGGHHSVAVKNYSSSKIVTKPVVKIVSSKPSVNNLPIPLHQQDDQWNTDV
jgi:hypothetical protein